MIPPVTATSPRRMSVAYCGDPLGHAVVAAGRVFGRHDRDVELLVQLDVAVDVLLDQGILVPGEAEFLDRAADPQGVLVLVRPHRIQHQLEIVADRLAHGPTERDIRPGLAMGMELVRGPAHLLEAQGLLDIGLRGRMPGSAGIDRDLVLAGAQQAMDRLPRDLAVDVPKADVERTDRVGRDRAVLFPQVPPEGADILRIAAHDDGLGELDQAGRVVIGADPGRAEEGVAADTLIGLDGDHAKLARAAERRPDAGFPGLGRPVEQIDLDVADLHDRRSLSRLPDPGGAMRYREMGLITMGPDLTPQRWDGCRGAARSRPPWPRCCGPRSSSDTRSRG